MRVRRGLWLRYYRVSLAGDQIHTFGLISTGRVCWPSHNVILQGRKYSNGTAFPSPSPASMFCVFFLALLMNTSQGRYRETDNQGRLKGIRGPERILSFYSRCWIPTQIQLSTQQTPQSGTGRAVPLRPSRSRTGLAAAVTGQLTVGSLSNPGAGFLCL